MKIEDIKDPSFLKNMNEKDLYALAKDIRTFLIENISKTGGHLSSNLGVVELTIALHYCFNSPEDVFLFDVGHQSYVHKILTGRANKFNTLRKFNGLSGFQRRNESIHDEFEAGHSSTALSTALGMAIARDLDHKNNYIIPIVGDGSMSSGLSLEALNQIGDLKSKVIIIFNDNNMSISKNVGALTKGFSRLRSSYSYNELKEEFKLFLRKYKNGENYVNAIKGIKNSVKDSVIDSGIFGEFDIDYLGPVDGHNIKDLIKAFNTAKLKEGPVVVHVMTKKGYGYKYTENDISGKWHGVGKFNIETGKSLTVTPEGYKSYSQIVADHVQELMRKNNDIVTITPAMLSGSKLEKCFAEFPNRCFDCGITEDHALCFASGLALNGKKPFVSIYSSFLQRAYDQMNHDVCRMNLPVVLGIDRASIVGEDGSSHQGVFDISFLRPLPNVVIAEGKNSNQIENLLDLAFKSNCPFVIRYPRGSIFYDNYTKTEINVGKWEKIINNNSEKATIISYGNDVITMQKFITENKLPYNLINALFIKPVDKDMIIDIGKKGKPIYIYTNDILKGGLGDEILEVFNLNNIHCPIHIFGVDDIYVKHGELSLVKESLNLDLKYFFNYIEKDLNA